MVAESSRYFVRSKGAEHGPYTLSQLSYMWVSGSLTADTLYRLQNVADWSPVVALADTLEALAPNKQTTRQIDAPSAEAPRPAEAKSQAQTPIFIGTEATRGGVLRGDGSRKNPYVVEAENHWLSARVQKEVIDASYGGHAYKVLGERLYSFSPDGLPGNKDLCEHRLLLHDKPLSVWFDLHLVTRLVEDPGLRVMQQVLQSATQLQMLGNRKKQERGSDRLHKGDEATTISPVILTPDECYDRVLIFRLKWFLIHLVVWIVLGSTRLGPFAFLGMFGSILILSVQVTWKKRQLLRSMGLSEQEINARLRSR